MSTTDVGDTWGEPRPTTGSTSSPKEMAASAAETVKQEAASFAHDARDKAAEKIEQHKQTATQTLGDFANAIRKAGDELSQTDQSMASRMVRQAADGLENLARSVSDKRPEEMIDAVRDFGRRNPTAFIAGSVLAGIALGRFLKSSSTPSTTAGFVGSGGVSDFSRDDPMALGAGGPASEGMSASGLAESTPADPSYIGAPEMIEEPPTDADFAASDLDRDDIGTSGADDADRSRFGPRS